MKKNNWVGKQSNQNNNQSNALVPIENKARVGKTPQTSKQLTAAIYVKEPTTFLAQVPSLNGRPSSAYTRMPSFTNSTTQLQSSQQARSKAVYGSNINSQLEDLKLKEISLEKAKSSLYLHCAEKRHQAEIEQVREQTEKEMKLIQATRQAQLTCEQKEHDIQMNRLTQHFESLLSESEQKHKLQQADWQAKMAKLESDNEHMISQLEQSHALHLQSINNEHQREFTDLQTALRTQAKNQQKILEGNMRKSRDGQVAQLCEKMAEEQFQEIQGVKQQLKEKIDHNGKLALEMRDIQSRNKRQEDFIFEIQRKLDLSEAENKQLLIRINEMNSVNPVHTLEIGCMTDLLQTFEREIQVDNSSFIENNNSTASPTKPQQDNPTAVMTEMELKYALENAISQVKILTAKVQEQESQFGIFVSKTWQKLEKIVKNIYLERKEQRKSTLGLEMQYQEAQVLFQILAAGPEGEDTVFLTQNNI